MTASGRLEQRIERWSGRAGGSRRELGALRTLEARPQDEDSAAQPQDEESRAREHSDDQVQAQREGADSHGW